MTKLPTNLYRTKTCFFFGRGVATESLIPTLIWLNQSIPICLTHYIKSKMCILIATSQKRQNV